ncbi:MAG TPA: hypothetical protein VEB61_02915 [Candidatus Binatia bacterium]|nr:hypothetical protein [Candidatus Binatia bacterium]
MTILLAHALRFSNLITVRGARRMVRSMSENPSSDTVAAEQYFATLRRKEHLEPERDLLLAILEDAIHIYRNYSRAKEPRRKERSKVPSRSA